MLAILYDAHANLPALEAVLADARALGARRWLIGGDCTLFGAWPEETLARLEELRGATWIRGNGERWTADPASAPLAPARAAAQACAEALGAATVARLAALPEQAVLDGVRYCHATPGSDVVGLLPEPAEDEAALLADDDDGALTLRRVAYDHAAAAAAVRTRWGDWAEGVARRIETAQLDPPG